MSTHIQCFRAKMREISIHLYTPVLLYKSGYKGVYITRTCYRFFSISNQKEVLNQLIYRKHFHLQQNIQKLRFDSFYCIIFKANTHP